MRSMTGGACAASIPVQPLNPWWVVGGGAECRVFVGSSLSGLPNFHIFRATQNPRGGV